MKVSQSTVKTFSSVSMLSHSTGLSSLDYIHILKDFFPTEITKHRNLFPQWAHYVHFTSGK